MRALTYAPAARPGRSALPQVADASSPPISARRALALGSVLDRRSEIWWLRAPDNSLHGKIVKYTPRVFRNQPVVPSFHAQAPVIVIYWPLGWCCLGSRLNRINKVSITTRCIFFFGSLSRKNLQVKRAWLGLIWDGWPTGKFSRVRMSEDKVCTKDSCWSVGTIYNPRELPGVSTAGPRIGQSVKVILQIEP
jgi:hypothetical protein